MLTTLLIIWYNIKNKVWSLNHTLFPWHCLRIHTVCTAGSLRDNVTNFDVWNFGVILKKNQIFDWINHCYTFRLMIFCLAGSRRHDRMRFFASRLYCIWFFASFAFIAAGPIVSWPFTVVASAKTDPIASGLFTITYQNEN